MAWVYERGGGMAIGWEGGEGVIDVEGEGGKE